MQPLDQNLYSQFQKLSQKNSFLPTGIFSPNLKIVPDLSDIMAVGLAKKITIHKVIHRMSTGSPLGSTDPNLQIYYKFENNLTDSSPNSNTLVKTAGTTTYVTSAIAGGTKALSFDGSTYYQPTTPGAPFSFERTQAFSTQCWINCAPLNNIALFSKDSSGLLSQGWQVYLTLASGNDGYINFALVNTASTNEIYARFFFVGLFNSTWHHIVTTYDGSVDVSGLKCYIDGVLQSPLNTVNNLNATTITANNFTICADHSGNSKYTGSFDEVAIWKYALSQAQVNWLYNIGSGQALQ